MKKMGLVLPGGGFHGAFQAGVLKFFEEKEIRFDYIIASSVGVINAVILGAKDGSAKQLCQFWENITPMDFFYPAWKEAFLNRRIDSFCSTKKLEEKMRKIADIYGGNFISEVEISTLNLDTGRVEYISNQNPDFNEAIWAGVAMVPFYPAVFLPQRKSQYVDGGLGRNYMIPRCFERGCDNVVLINLIETQKTRAKIQKENKSVSGLKEVFWRTATLVIKRVFADSSGQKQYDNKKVLKIFSPKGTYFSILFPSKRWFRKMIKVGYKEAERMYNTSSFFKNF